MRFDFKPKRMEIIRKTNVLIKTARKFVVHRSESGEQIRCEQCDELMLPAQTSADFFGISVRAVYRLVEAGKLRFIETSAKNVFVCPQCSDANLIELSNSK